MNTEYTKVTPEVQVGGQYLYLVRVDKEEMAFVESKEEAILVVDSLAASEQNRLKDDWTEVFRQDTKEGREVVISTKALGYLVNGSLTKAVTIDCIPVCRASLIKNRHVISEAGSSDSQESVPIPEVLERMAKEAEISVETEDEVQEEDSECEDSEETEEDEE